MICKLTIDTNLFSVSYDMDNCAVTDYIISNVAVTNSLS